MSDSSTEVVTAEESGIVVEKSFEGDEFAVPAIKFLVQSDRDEPTSVRIADEIPEGFPMDNVGFHPDYENDNWTAYKDHRVQFERELDPGEELVTVYGVRLAEDDDPESFLGPASIEQVAPETAEDEADDADASDRGDEVGGPEGNTITDIVSEEDSRLVRDVAAGDDDLGLDESAESEGPGVDPDPLAGGDPLADADPEPDAEADADADADREEPLAGAESDADDEEFLEPDEGDAEPADGTGRADGRLQPGDEPLTADVDSAAEPPASPPKPGSVAAALADEIRAGEVSEEDLDLIQNELDVATPESTNVRIRHLQSRVEDLSAYTEALEEFIDENGVAEDVLGEFEDDLARISEEVEDLSNVESELDRVTEELEDLATLSEDIESLESDLEDVGGFDEDVETIETRLDELEDLVGANTDDVSGMRDELASVADRLDDATDVAEDIDDLSEDIESLSADLDGLEEDLNARIDRVEDDVADVHDEIEGLKQWRDQLSDVFGT